MWNAAFPWNSSLFFLSTERFSEPLFGSLSCCRTVVRCNHVNVSWPLNKVSKASVRLCVFMLPWRIQLFAARLKKNVTFLEFLIYVQPLLVTETLHFSRWQVAQTSDDNYTRRIPSRKISLALSDRPVYAIVECKGYMPQIDSFEHLVYKALNIYYNRWLTCHCFILINGDFFI